MLKTEATKSEWLVATEGQVSVCAGVTNGQIRDIKVNGAFGGEGCQSAWFRDDKLYLAEQLRDALTAIVAEIPKAMERTAPETATEEPCQS